MSMIDLTWNPQSNVLWASRKRDLETRFALLKWHDCEGEAPKACPFQIGFEIKQYCQKAGILGVSAIAWDAMPRDMIYGVKAVFADGIATLYLFSNMATVYLIAQRFEKTIVPRGNAKKGV